MKNIKNTKWFTLVELIIVVTILAILATIAFVSFQSYTAQTRDTKVKSELWTIRNSIESNLAEWVSVLSFASNTWSNIVAPWTLSLWWTWIVLTDVASYKAWDLNTTLVWITTENTYKIWTSTKIWWVYQLAWKLTDGWDKAYVLGNFSRRTSTNVASWSYVVATTKLTLTSWVWIFKVWDIIVPTAWTNTWIITAISSDLSTLTLSWVSAALTAYSSSWVRLAADESTWLIWWTSTTWSWIIVDWLTNLP